MIAKSNAPKVNLATKNATSLDHNNDCKALLAILKVSVTQSFYILLGDASDDE